MTRSRPTAPELRLSEAASDAIRAQLEAAYPEEACGGLLARPGNGPSIEVLEAVPAPNVRGDERRRRYLIGPDQVLEIERRADALGLQVAGYYHSHPDAPPRPSDYDRDHAWPWYVYLIVSVREGRVAEARAWRLTEDRSGFTGVDLDESIQRTIEAEER